MGGTDWREPPPFWFVRLSSVESREKNKEGPHAGSNRGTASFPLDAAVSLVMLATLDLMTLAAARADVGCHTALSIFFRL